MKRVYITAMAALVEQYGFVLPARIPAGGIP